MKMDLTNIQKNFERELVNCKNIEDTDALYLKYFSKKNGVITGLISELSNVSDDDKRRLGPQLNKLKSYIKEKIEETRKIINNSKIYDENIDLSYLQGYIPTGKLHPTTKTIREMNNFFRYYGFSVVDGPEIENSTYNFRKLNLPKGHPATDLQDTLFIKQNDLDDDNEILLRTHTSSVEARVLTNYEPPIRVVVPGKTFRNETVNSTNSSFFYQYQGVVVDSNITVQNLIDTLDKFHKFLFGEDTVLRFRYKYYPEVSPGVGVDMMCKFCNGEGCTVCKMRGFIEVLGSGMIHYNTLKMCGIDPEIYTGFAFGMGLDRLVMQKFGINDIRHLYEGGMIYV